MTIERTTDSTTEPVTLTEVKQALDITSSFNDTEITSLAKSARQSIEYETERSLITQTWTMKLDDWPNGSVIYLPKGSVLSITSVNYINTGGDSTVLTQDTDFYFTAGEKARLVPVNSWPSLHATKKDGITIVYTAGYGPLASDVPEELKTAIKARTKYMYDELEQDKIATSIIGPYKLIFDWSRNA